MLNRPTFLQSLKEDFEDFRLGLGDEFAGIMPSTKERVKEHYVAVKEHVKEKAPQVLNGLKDVKRDIQHDAADDLDDLIQSFRKFRRSMQSGITEGEEDADASSVITPSEQISIREQIRKYEADLRSEFYVTELSKFMEESLPSSEELIAYYESRPELEEFTIEKELTRMSYTVYTHEGKKLTEASEVEEYYHSTNPKNNSQDTATTNPTPTTNNQILWRSANQSLLGDLVVGLTSRTGLIRPHLEAATFVSDLSMIVDFARDQPYAQAECFLNLSVPGLEGQRLSLAGVLVVVYFCPSNQKFKAKISHVFPSAPLTEEEVNGAARALS